MVPEHGDRLTERWTCPTCHRTAETPFCPMCGERPLSARDLTLRGFLEHSIRGALKIDGRLIRSFRCLVSHPGVLTVAYLHGQRKLYNTPLQLFFLANLLFFAVHFQAETKVFSAPLRSHLHEQPWSAVAARLTTKHLEKAHTTLDLYAPVFDRAVALHAKSMNILMMLPFALLTPILFYSSRRPFVAHVVFSLHFYAFLLLLFCVVSAALGIYEFHYGVTSIPDTLDHVLSFLLIGVCAAYLSMAARTVYGTRGAGRALVAIVLTVAVAGTVLGYRFALLLITLYST